MLAISFINVIRVVDDFNSYAKLGLTLNLNPLAHGGFERPTDTSIQEPSPVSPAIDMVDDEPCIPTGFGKILRDDTGNIIGFEASEIEECTNSEVVEVEGLQLDADDRAVHQRWVANFPSSRRMDPQGKCVLRGGLIIYVVNLDFSSWHFVLAFEMRPLSLRAL